MCTSVCLCMYVIKIFQLHHAKCVSVLKLSQIRRALFRTAEYQVVYCQCRLSKFMIERAVTKHVCLVIVYLYV
jgi:hypothetical protein